MHDRMFEDVRRSRAKTSSATLSRFRRAIRHAIHLPLSDLNVTILLVAVYS
jgi:hypothetical protein